VSPEVVEIWIKRENVACIRYGTALHAALTWMVFLLSVKYKVSSSSSAHWAALCDGNTTCSQYKCVIYKMEVVKFRTNKFSTSPDI
jgi:hypothetical protein